MRRVIAHGSQTRGRSSSSHQLDIIAKTPDILQLFAPRSRLALGKPHGVVTTMSLQKLIDDYERSAKRNTVLVIAVQIFERDRPFALSLPTYPLPWMRV